MGYRMGQKKKQRNRFHRTAGKRHQNRKLEYDDKEEEQQEHAFGALLESSHEQMEDGVCKVSCRKPQSFPAADYTSDVELDTRELVRAQNKKKKKSGGFQSMGLSFPVFKGIMKRGYKVPTPIQRKTIPVIMDGKDVVAMARTGSGKTACFLIPMFERLKAHTAQTGARALILSPTRELALQTMKFTKELGKFTGLTTALILGGDKMEDQFAALHENPDIIIGTPGRLMHVVMEMNLKLNSVEYVVFDEADRLFEMGFAQQLEEIIRRLPDNRQTLLFSATLPKLLVEFARAGLTEPVLIRLDLDSKLSEQLKLAFFHVRVDDKPAVLLHLLRDVVKPQEQTVIFAATKHHVEYLKEVLLKEGIDCSYIYSALDQTARKINIGKFVNRKTMVMIVTDVAARGIDIPMLDNVINYNFPPKSKLFLHRVGRVARAGRSGTALSLVAPDEAAYVFDLHLFLGRPLRLVSPGEKMEDTDGMYGRVPQSIIDEEDSLLIVAHDNSSDLQSLRRVSENAYKQYTKSRQNPSTESVKRTKEIDFSMLGIHPLLSSGLEDSELERLKVVDLIKNYKSKATIFEINSTNKSNASEVMRAKRSRDRRTIQKYRKSKEEKQIKELQRSVNQSDAKACDPECDEENLAQVFTEVVGMKKKKHSDAQTTERDEFYIPYRPKDFESERGLSIAGEGSSFERQASGAVLDLLGDSNEDLKKGKQMMKWDRKRKRFVHDRGTETTKKVKTESGLYINRSYKKNLYDEWKKKYRVDDRASGDESDDQTRNQPKRGKGHRGRSTLYPKRQGSQPRTRPELKSKEQILKERKMKAKQKFLQSGGLKRLKAKNKPCLQDLRKSAFGRRSGKKGKMKKRL